ncbi:MAG: SAVED domain-containing protein [Verrucomicrobiaceae bacterium]|nr:MAG: SAVED domain-containing protein [Verrucomicrobiaceae bacterium]
MPKEITRHIKRDVERELWGRAAARCQFKGCNELLYKSPLTQEKIHLAEKAHIWSHSENGPRGRGPLAADADKLNGVENLLLVCPGCHEELDKNNGNGRYTGELLKDWKREHEDRIRIVTGISAEKRSLVVLYGARIGEEKSPLHFGTCASALFPDWHPTDDRAINLSMSSSLDDSLESYWSVEADHLRREFDRHVKPRVESGEVFHVSLFGLAPQPLLILLGSLMTDKVPSRAYQLHRSTSKWDWQTSQQKVEFKIVRPSNVSGPPALVISLSGKIDEGRIRKALGEEMTIWEVTIETPHNDFIKSAADVGGFMAVIPPLMEQIASTHPGMDILSIFPAMPVSCAIELGRCRMPKAHAPWRIYDQHIKHGGFIPTITIGE